MSRKEFHNEAEAFEHVKAILWPQGPVCRKCGSMECTYHLRGVRTKPSKKNPHGVERHGLYKCAACRSQFTVRMGTIFKESLLPLTKWATGNPSSVDVQESYQRPPDAPRAQMHL